MGDETPRRRWSRIVRPDARAEVNEELTFHFEERVREYEARGMAPDAARAAARERLGDLAGVQSECTELLKTERRTEARRDWLKVSWLDFKLGFRMLLRYPGLTIVGGLAMAFALWVGAGTFELVTQVVRPTLPLHDGHRIVGLRMWDVEGNAAESQIVHDFARWRTELRSVEELGAFRSLQRNLVTGEGRGEPTDVAEISASAFRVAAVPPLLGRTLVDADERLGAPPVAVIGHGLWQSRFGGDSGVVGSTVRLGTTAHTVVGVMPERFEFPVANGFWVPLRLDPREHGPREGPGIRVFGRLAQGATLAQAQAELAALGLRAAVDFPDTHQRLLPQVLPYAKSILDVSGWALVGLLSINVPGVLFLVLVCANVALLMFARAATRENELVVRTALGASRGRIVVQLFTEALVLGAVAAVIGLAAAGLGLRWLMNVVEAEILEGGRLPFWFDASLSGTTILYAALLTVLGAAVAGVVPALKVTRGVGERLRQATSGGGGLRFGGVWTLVIVSQVAVTVAFPVVAFFVRRDAVQLARMQVNFAEAEFLSARLEMDREPPPGVAADTSQAAFLARFEASFAELERRLEADPAVAGVTYADRLPRMYHPHRLIGMDEGGTAPLHPSWPGGHRVSAASVGPGFFDVVRAPVLAGRGFHSGDFTADSRQVIVNESFVRLVLGDRNPIGRRLQYRHYEEWDEPREEQEPGPWYEIVGVVPDMGMDEGGEDPKVAGIYHPAAPGSIYPAQLAVHVRGDPAAFAPRLRALATEVDPTLRLYQPVRMDQMSQAELEFISFWFRFLLAVSGVALFLSLAGIYAVMSFTVSRRTREIGIRVALGANPRRVILAIFRRPLIQVAAGIVAGIALMSVLIFGANTGDFRPTWMAMLILYAAVMFGVCMLACIVPTRRALRVEPTEALRADG